MAQRMVPCPHCKSPLPEHASFCPYCAQSVRPRRSVKPPSHLWGKALRWGLGRGLLAGLVLGILDFMLGGGISIGWQSILGDYVVAFTVLGLAGLFRGKSWSVFAGTVVGSVARFLVHYVVGATLWAAYMPETFFGMTMTSPWIYSLLYNGCYMLLDMLLCLVVFALLLRPMHKYLLAEDLK